MTVFKTRLTVTVGVFLLVLVLHPLFRAVPEFCPGHALVRAKALLAEQA